MRHDPTAIMPILLPYQQELVADASPVVVAEKGRRIGGTFAVCVGAVYTAATPAAHGGMDVWYMAMSGRDSKDFLRVAADIARAFDEAVGRVGGVDATKGAQGGITYEDGEGRAQTIPGGYEHAILYKDSQGRHKSILVTSIQFKSGHRITALPGKPDVLRGKAGLVIFDEAALLDINACLKAAGALKISMGTPGRIIFVSTHRGENNGFNELVCQIREGRAPRGWSLHTIDLHRAVADGFYRRSCMLARRPWSKAREDAWLEELLEEPGAEAEYLCIPSRDGDTYFPADLVERSTSDRCVRVSWTLPPGWEMTGTPASRRDAAAAFCEHELAGLLAALPRNRSHTIGVDYGRSATGDLEVFVPMTLVDDSPPEDPLEPVRARVPFILELVGVPHHEQFYIADFIISRLPRLRGGRVDATGGGDALAEHIRQRHPQVLSVHLSGKWYEKHTPPYKRALQAEAIELPAYPQLVEDHKVFELDDGIAKPRKRRIANDRGGKRHGDAAIGCVFAYAAARDTSRSVDHRPPTTIAIPRPPRRRSLF